MERQPVTIMVCDCLSKVCEFCYHFKGVQVDFYCHLVFLKAPLKYVLFFGRVSAPSGMIQYFSGDYSVAMVATFGCIVYNVGMALDVIQV